MRGVDLDERLHAHFAAECNEVAKQRIYKYGDDEEEAIRIVRASFPDLPGIEDKILAQNRELDGLAGVAEIFQRAAEKFAFGQNGESGSARSFERLREGHGIERIAKDAARRRCRLEFRKHVWSIAAEPRGTIAERSGCLPSALQRGLRQPAS